MLNSNANLTISVGSTVDALTLGAGATAATVTNNGTISAVDGEGDATIGGSGTVGEVSNASLALKYATTAKDKFSTAYSTDPGKANLDWDTLITAVHFYEQAVDAEADVTLLTNYYKGITILDMNGKNKSKYAISTGVFELFTGLSDLKLSTTKITDLGGLVGLTDLKKLDVSANNITNLGALVNMTNLEELNISNTKITDLNVLVKEGNVSRFANLVNLQATDISTLTSIAGLVHVANDGTQSASVIWKLAGSTLSSDTDNHIGQINGAKDAATFNAPALPLM